MTDTTFDVGDGFVYPRAVALKAAAQLFLAIQTLHGRVYPPRLVNTLSELLGGPQWLAVANELIDELEADPGFLNRLLGLPSREASDG